jgi:hypothetical protein
LWVIFAPLDPDPDYESGYGMQNLFVLKVRLQNYFVETVYLFAAVLGIRIRMFLGLPDPEPDP